LRASDVFRSGLSIGATRNKIDPTAKGEGEDPAVDGNTAEGDKLEAGRAGSTGLMEHRFDGWADARGMFMSAAAAGSVYKL